MSDEPGHGLERNSQAPDGHGGHGEHKNLLALTLSAMGVVYGDIGTSPLYAVNEIFFGHAGVARRPENVVGCISLIVWTLTMVIAFKYVLFVLRADNDGEGGTFALYGLIHRYKRLGLGALLSLLILAAGLLFGEGVITPAISVLSAVEGLEVAEPRLHPWIIPLTLVILTGLFVVQRKGTAKVGTVFGPVILCWFLSIAFFGAKEVMAHREILAALNPLRGVEFLRERGALTSLPVLGGVVLAITGGEALFADMGHFGKGPIRLSWFSVVYPALVTSYLGQGAFLLGPEAVQHDNVFFSMVPRALALPMVVLATLATIIASQALISGAFSLSAQAVALGLFPRLKIVHTHQAHAGQIYVPVINWALYVGCTTLVVRFGSSTALAAAYGLSVSGVMLSTSIAMTAIARLKWDWSWPAIALAFVPVGLVDATFLTANSTKFLDGGFVPFTIGMLVFLVMTTWRWGRKATFAAYSGKHTMTMAHLVELKKSATLLEKNAILLVPKPLRSLHENTPALLQLVWDRQQALPKNLVFVEVVHKKTPYVHGDRVSVTVFDRAPTRGSVVSVALSFGFMEDPNVERMLEHLASHHEIDLPPDPHQWIVYASQENLLVGRHARGLTRFRIRLFALLRQISQPSYYYYGVGDTVQLTTEIMPVRLAKS
jgi:KUP system potassium uptake protein